MAEENVVWKFARPGHGSKRIFSNAGGPSGSRKFVEDGFDPVRRHRRRPRRGHQNRPAEFAANQPGTFWLLSLKDQLVALQRERDFLTGLEMKGFPQAIWG